jgi:hypothetical protein
MVGEGVTDGEGGSTNELSGLTAGGAMGGKMGS